MEHKATIIHDYVRMIQKMDAQLPEDVLPLIAYFLTVLESCNDFEICLDVVVKDLHKLGFKTQKNNLARLLADQQIDVYVVVRIRI